MAAQGVASWRLGPDLRAWQREAFERWRQEGQHGIAKVVTGAGKTVFAERCMLDFIERAPSGHVVVVVPTLALLDQWYVSLQEDLGVEPREIALFSGEGCATQSARVNLAVLNTARTVAPVLSRERKTFLVVDECHRAGAPVNGRALDGSHLATLGLSATPEREYDEAFEEVLVPALGPVICDYDYAHAKRDRVVADFTLVNVRIQLSTSEQDEYDRLTRRAGAAARAYEQGKDDGKRLQQALRRRAAVSAGAHMRIPVAVALADRARGSRTLIFHEQIAAANELKELLATRRHNVALYHSKIAPAVRRDNLRLFRRGVFQTLVSCRALDEGVNVPETSVGIIASSTASVRQRIQRLGRVLRPARGKAGATIYTLYATDTEGIRLEREAQTLIGVAEVLWQKAGVANA